MLVIYFTAQARLHRGLAGYAARSYTAERKADLYF